MDQHLEDTIFTLPAMLHQTPTHTQTLDTPTARHLDTAIDPTSHDHSWLVVTTSDLTKSKSTMKLPEGITELGVLVYTPCSVKLNLCKYKRVYTNCW